MKLKQYEMAELTVPGEVTGVFSHGGKTVTVRSFPAGENLWKLRFLPTEAGLWHWRITGAAETEGEAFCEPGDRHGPVRAEGTCFRHADGTLYRPFGTTVYALIHQEQRLIDTTMATLRAGPFNKVRLCVFPKDYRYNKNEPDWFAFERDPAGGWDVRRPCFAFWDHLDRRLEELDRIGIQADLILFHPYDRWGFAAMSREQNLAYLDYAMRRLAAHPNVWWSLANEYDLCLDRKTVAEWEEIEAFVAANDPYRHPLSCHNCFQPWDFARPAVTHVSIQTKRLADVPRLLARYGKPVVVDECCYEGQLKEFWGSISGEEMTARFWRVFTDGGYCTHGETYDDENDVIWWAKGGVLKGTSPARIAFLRAFAEELPGPLEPLQTPFTRLIAADEADLDRLATELGIPQVFAAALKRMPFGERQIHAALEHEPAGHCGTEAYLWYYDARPVTRAEIRLPEEDTYTVEILDTWNMTREKAADGIRGTVTVSMPGRPWMALYARAERGKS